MNTVAIAPIRKSILVNAAPERAFKVFTEGMTHWWKKQHSINASPIAVAIVLMLRGRTGRLDIGHVSSRGEEGICDGPG